MNPSDRDGKNKSFVHNKSMIFYFENGWETKMGETWIILTIFLLIENTPYWMVLESEEFGGFDEQLRAILAQIDPFGAGEDLGAVSGDQLETVIAQTFRWMQIGQSQRGEDVIDSQLLDYVRQGECFQRGDIVFVSQGEETFGHAFRPDWGRGIRVEIRKELAEYTRARVFDRNYFQGPLFEIVDEHGRHDRTAGRQHRSVSLQDFPLHLELNIGQHPFLEQGFQVLEECRFHRFIRRWQVDNQLVVRIVVAVVRTRPARLAMPARALPYWGVPCLFGRLSGLEAFLLRIVRNHQDFLHLAIGFRCDFDVAQLEEDLMGWRVRLLEELARERLALQYLRRRQCGYARAAISFDINHHRILV